MAKVTQIRQGESLPFSFDLDGVPLEGRTCTIYVKQFLKDASTITREIPLDSDQLAFSGFLTAAETAALKVGSWRIFADMPNVTEGRDRQVVTKDIRFDVAETVVDSVAVITAINLVSSGTAIPAGGNFARFNFTVGPTFTVGQQIVISGYTTNTLYNDTGLVLSTGAGFVEITSQITFLAIKFVSDEAGGSISS